ncbi:dolichyl-phosphate-mannose-protein mannosyltransferase [Hydrogenivirga caldilitoris]|uniref:Dolichyl-phosphate-mannose-protein mannosyltransferase n=1 Tax=Hydrogenivirga caldilitoris TaxID=246264 RepID=A0A497XRE9_9AQUI|nr:glycosyltransferase family 39 protein [Hydrogenivirga caldilitoris]RLJ71508.1 dolichyl-phosphate-mannose-protein mannosyltransferase [Hydrogenivirga caldilitoris]
MKLLAVFLTVLCFISLIPNIGNYQFRGEEALRTMVAYEMDKSGNLMQPTLLGEPYYNKPPLFNWLILLSSKFIPWSELTARAVTLTSLLLTLIIIYTSSRVLVKNEPGVAYLAPLVFISFSDVLFWYGYLAEIDITLTMFNSLALFLLYVGFESNRTIFIVAVGIVIGLSFLLKGLPSYGLWLISCTALLIIYRNKLNNKVLISILVASLIALIIPALWLLNTNDPIFYIKKLFSETVSKVKGQSGVIDYLKHLFMYPVINFKQLLPTSIFVIYMVFRGNRRLPRELRILLFICLLNYLPYLLSAEGKGRYVLPLFPLLAVVFSYLVLQNKKYLKPLILTIFVLAVFRILFGFWALPLLEKQRGPIKESAYKIHSIVGYEDRIACECKTDERKAVCLYLDFLRKDFLKTARLTPDWKYLVSCEPKHKLKEVLNFHIRKDDYVFLYLRQPLTPKR